MLLTSPLAFAGGCQDLRRDLLNLTDFAETKDMGHAVKEGYITEEMNLMPWMVNSLVDNGYVLPTVNLLVNNG